MGSAAAEGGGNVQRAGRTALLAAVMTVGLIAYGAWVRASGSGLGCPDWPLCQGAIVPGLEGDTAIEFGHRVFAGLTLLAVLAAAAMAFAARRGDPGLARILSAALVVMLLQAGLGGATVLTELHGMVRLAHLAFAFSALTLLTFGALRGLGAAPSPSPGLKRATLLAAGGAIVVLAGGAIVGSGTAAGCPALPLCDDRSTVTASGLHELHRAVWALLLLGLIATGAGMARRRRLGGPAATALATALNHGALALLALQGTLGVLMILDFRTAPIAEHLRIAHVTVAALFWWALSAAWWLAYETRRQRGA